MSRLNTTIMARGWCLSTILVINIFVLWTTAHLLPEIGSSMRSRDIRNPQDFRGTKNLLQRFRSIVDSKKESGGMSKTSSGDNLKILTKRRFFTKVFGTARRDEIGDENHYPDVTGRGIKSSLETDIGSAMTDANQKLYGNGDESPPVPVTQDQFDEFIYWAQMCAATYCPENIVHGRNSTVLKCGLAGNCKEIEKDGWTTKYEFKKCADDVLLFMICDAN